jgi:hypothetical protein
MQHGRQLLSASNANEALERLLAVARLLLGITTDMLRPSTDPQDSPITVLGHHTVSRRQVD